MAKALKSAGSSAAVASGLSYPFASSRNGEPEYSHHMGKRVAIYGPNYIWTCTLVGETDTALIVEDVWQVFETGAHDQKAASLEKCSDIGTFPKTAICNVVEPKWATQK